MFFKSSYPGTLYLKNSQICPLETLETPGNRGTKHKPPHKAKTASLWHPVGESNPCRRNENPVS